MLRKRVNFGEFDVHVPKGHQQITDKDATTDYLFINAPRDIYSVYFDSVMPFYTNNVLADYETGSSVEIKYPDKKISLFCPTRTKGRQDALWYFNIEFFATEDESLVLPGQIMVNSDEVYKKTVGGKLPFIEILEKIKLKPRTDNAV